MTSGSNGSSRTLDNSQTSGPATQPSAQGPQQAGPAHSREASPARLDAPQAQVTIQCDALVEAFRWGENTSKPDVLAQIMRILSNFFSAHPGNDADFSNALRVYVEMLDNCEAEQRALLQEGEGQVRARTGNEAEEEGQQRPRPATPIEDENPGPADRDGDRDGGDESDREGRSGDGRGPAK